MLGASVEIVHHGGGKLEILIAIKHEVNQNPDERCVPANLPNHIVERLAILFEQQNISRLREHIGKPIVWIVKGLGLSWLVDCEVV